MAKRKHDELNVVLLMDQLDDVVTKIDSMGPVDLLEAERRCKDIQNDMGMAASQRKSWGLLASLLRLSAR